MSDYEITRVGHHYQLVETHPTGALCAVLLWTREEARTWLFRRMVTLSDDELDDWLATEEEWVDY